MPYDQGELVSCYVRTSEALDASRLLSLYQERYADEPFVELAAEPPGVSGVRETNLCRIHVALDEASGRAMAFASIDNLWKGAASRAIQNLNLMPGLPEEEDLLSPRPRPSSPRGGSSAGWGRGLDPRSSPRLPGGRRLRRTEGGGATDVGVIVCDEEGVRSALALTRNAAAAAPVRVCRDDCDADSIRAAAVAPATRTPRPGSRATGTPSRCAMRPPRRSGSSPGRSPSLKRGRSGYRSTSRPSLPGSGRRSRVSPPRAATSSPARSSLRMRARSAARSGRVASPSPPRRRERG